MLLLLCNYFSNFHFINLFHYISFRASIAFILSFVTCLCCFPSFISFLKYQVNKNQPIRKEGLGPDHSAKVGTPTIGGVIILFAITLSILLTADLLNIYVIALLFVLLSFGFLGFVDDFLKITKQNTHGVSGKVKLIVQIAVSLVVVAIINYNSNDWYSGSLLFPVFKNFALNIGVFYTIFRIIVITGASNAINLTDGLDGLVTMPLILSAACLGVFAYIIGSSSYADYLLFTKIKGASELVVPISAFIGACFGFLWFNAKPAQIFMGDVGSLSLGGFLGTVATIIKCEIIFAIIGGLFVIEALSVILQVYYFRITGGKRIFKMAPIHHHFEKCGWSETQVVIRFWIIALLFAIVGLMMIKIR